MMTCARAVAALLLLTIGLEAQQILNTPSAIYPTIQSAINSAASGDTVLIGAGTFAEQLTLFKSLTIEGAGAGTTIIDGNLSGRCLTINIGANATVTLRNLEFRRGFASGTASFAPGFGGGVLFRTFGPGTAALNLESVTMRDCKAFKGAALSTAPNGTTTLTDCDFITNKFDPIAVMSQFGGNGLAIHIEGDVVADDCNFLNNDTTDLPINLGPPNGNGGAIHIEPNASCLLRGCLFDGNRARTAGAISAGVNSTATSLFQLRIEDSIFRNNSAFIQFGAIVAHGGAATSSIEIINSLFHDNSCDQLVYANVGGLVAEQILISGCTFARNRSISAFPYRPLSLGSTTCLIENSIFSDNGLDVVTPSQTSGSSTTIRNSLLTDSENVASYFDVATGIIEGIPAGFVDSASRNFRLMAGSPAVDSGVVSMNLSTLDLDGLPRSQLGAPDMGCFELQPGHEDPGANWAGTVPDMMGGVDDVLLVNGGAGDVGRRVNTMIGTTTTIAVDAAPGTLSGNFIIWGRIGLPGIVEAFPIPFAQGSMAFVPHILAVGNPSLFTFASSSLPGGIFAASPAPWSVTGSSLPYPLTITLQGLIETGGGNVRLTNAIAVHNF